MVGVRTLLSLLICAIAVVGAGCGSSEEQAAPAAATTSTGADHASFPAVATHRYGSTTVPKRPQRIVVVGVTEQDMVLALGYRPIATTEWYGDKPGAIWPWARKLMGSTNPMVLQATDGIPIEKVAALRPDLIIG